MQVDDLKNCQLIFISKSEKKHVTEILSALDDKPVLTVSEIEGFAERGGGINFYLEGKKVRFEVNPDAARHDGLKVSSQLLSLGKIIETAKEAK
jgi:YfiR/HmsC-like